MKNHIVVAVDQNFGIGKKGQLPWHFSAEMKYFKDLTTGTQNPEKDNAVIMGRKTWMSLPDKYRPLPGRKNIVLTRDENFQAQGATVAHSLEEAFSIVKADSDIENTFIIGGAELFKAAIDKVDGVYLTRIDDTFDCDTFFPQIPSRFKQPEKLGEDSDKNTKLEYFFYSA